MRHVLFLLGIEDNNKVTVRSVLPKNLDYVVSGNIDPYRDLEHPELTQHLILLGGSRPRAPRVPKPDVVFNCIANSDTNRRSLALATTAVQALGVPVINDPARVLVTSRDEIAAKLAGIPTVTMPLTVRIKPTSHRQILDALDQGPVRYPALLRRTGTHGGINMLLLHSAADAPILERIACDGTEYYLTEFVDFRSDDGHYRKIRIVMADGKPYIRHQIIAPDWNLHAASRDNDEALLRDEENFLARFNEDLLPRWQDGFNTIQQRVGLDYYTIDCAVHADGSLLVFEANASGNSLRRRPELGKNYLDRHVAILREAVIHMMMHKA